MTNLNKYKMNRDELLKERPNVDDFDYQPYSYISALTNYINKLEAAISVTRCCTELLCDCGSDNIDIEPKVYNCMDCGKSWK